MRARALTIDYAATGVGILRETEHRFSSLSQAFFQGLPVGRYWRSELQNSAKRPRKALVTPQHFRGWQLAQHKVGPDDTFIVYHSEQALAAALNAGTLTPLGGAELLERWDLRAPSRPTVSKSRLASRRAILRSLKVVPLSFLAANDLFDVSASPLPSWFPFQDDDFDFEEPHLAALSSVEPAEAVLMRKATGLGWGGRLRLVLTPITVTYAGGLVMRRASFLAQFPRKPGSEHRFPFPLLFHDGAAPRLVPSIDALDPGVVEDFERSGSFHLIDAVKLRPPENFRARYVFRWQGPEPAADEEFAAEPPVDEVELPPGLVPIPAFAAAAISPNIRRLEGPDAHKAWRMFAEAAPRLGARPSLSGDLLLCAREGLGAPSAQPVSICRQTSFEEETW